MYIRKTDVPGCVEKQNLNHKNYNIYWSMARPSSRLRPKPVIKITQDAAFCSILGKSKKLDQQGNYALKYHVASGVMENIVASWN